MPSHVVARESRGEAAGEARPAPVSARGRGSSLEEPRAKYSVCQRRVKDEDVIFVREAQTAVSEGPPWSLYCLCDGHGGGAAAKFVRRNLWRELAPCLPRAAPPDYDGPDFRAFAADLRGSIITTFAKINEQFGIECSDEVSGTTLTVALLCGRLLTVANVGDSDAILDTGDDAFLTTVNHKIQTNYAERERLTDAGVDLVHLTSIMKGTVVAGERGVGPLRCWPGGQAVSRSIGDIKAGESILPCPHVFQAIVPLTGARLTMASDGVWDSLHWEDAARLARSSAIGHAAAAVVNEAARRCNGPLPEDASALVLDLIPGRRGDFSKVVKERAGGADGRRWGRGLSLYSCVCGAQRPTADACAFDKLRVVATADGLEAADSETDACKRRRECGRELARGRSSEWRPVGDSALSFDTGKIVGTGSAELGLSLDDRVVVASGGSPHWPGARRAHDSAGSSPTSSDESIRADPRRGARAKRPTRSSSHSLQSIALKASNGDRPFSFLYKSPVAGGQAGSQAGGGKKATALFQLATILKRLSCEFSPERRACEAPAQGAQLRSGSQRCKTGAW